MTPKTKHWEDSFIPLFESGAIQIDEDGNIWRLKRKCYNPGTGQVDWTRVAPRRMGNSRNGYLKSAISVDGVVHSVGNHRIVYRCLVGLIPFGAEINHIDGNKKNNRKDNLEAITPKENMRHAGERGLRRTTKGRRAWSKLSETEVLKIREGLRSGRQGREIAPLYGVSETTISAIKLGRQWKSLVG